MRTRFSLMAAVAAVLVVGAVAVPAAAAPPPDPATASPAAAPSPDAARPGGPAGAIGAPGVGDPFFPLAGNGGIDVQDYDLRLAYTPSTKRLEGTATLRIVATQDLSRFDLDLRGFDLGPVTVDGAPATVARAKQQELQITPKRPLRKGATFAVVVPYAGVPDVVIDPDGSPEGFVPTKDGAVVVNEPQGSPGWYPANDTPRDKATYTIAMTVPAGLTAVGNGALVSQTSAGGRTTFTWRERFPMAPYLTTITLGKFAVTTGRAAGVPSYVAVDPSQAVKSAPVLSKLPEMVAFLQNLYGPYPFETVGAIVDDAPELGYALETQTKPVFDSAPDDTTLLHELSHQWYGDAVTLRQWPDIWLHEGFATWSEWIWAERHGGPSAKDQLADLAATPASDKAFWNPPPGDPGRAANLFDGTIYDRGAMTLQALREQIGDPAFFTVMRRWYAEHKYGNVSTPEFVALAQQVSRQNLGAFFKAWLYTPGKPAFLTDANVAATARVATDAPGRGRR